MSDTPTIPELRTALRLVVDMLKDEYPYDKSLSEIVDTWGNAETFGDIHALEVVEAWLES